MDRGNHYETAFEAYLQWHRFGYIAVDETRRSLQGTRSIKNLDFIVYGPAGARLLIDIKGRRFPGGSAAKPRRVWECWSTQDDVDGLDHWVDLFGAGYQGLLVFAYQLAPTLALSDETADLWTWRGQRYLWRAITVEDYRRHLRIRSPKWGTVDIPGAIFRALSRPLHDFMQNEQSLMEEYPF